MQYVRSISGSVSKTWNSINPATLSGAIDVIAVQHPDGSLSCSPFHVRFGKFSLLRPSEKKVEFKVNDVRQDYSMKLGEGGEAFFVFETTANVPENLQTSPLVSPVASPASQPSANAAGTPIPDVEPLDLNNESQKNDQSERTLDAGAKPMLIPERRTYSDQGGIPLSQSFPDDYGNSHTFDPWPERHRPTAEENQSQPGNGFLSGITSSHQHSKSLSTSTSPHQRSPSDSQPLQANHRPNSPPLLPKKEALDRAMTLSKKLWSSNIPSHVNEEGDLMLDMTGYKTNEDDALRAEVVARKILSEELEGDYDIGSLIGADEKGNLWIYSSEEAKEAAAQKASFPALSHTAMVSTDALSDPGYHSDEDRSSQSMQLNEKRDRRESDSSFGLTTPPDSPKAELPSSEPTKTYAKTLRLTSDQLKSLDLKPGPNAMSFSVNRATCQAYMYLWRYETPIVISDIDGTITKSDALGHVLNMIGRDWTHLGVAKLYSDIVTNGYNILYLTSRSVGQADSTRTYISGIVQEGYKLPKGPVIMSPDRTIAALRREIYLRKPEVFKMACLRDIMSLFTPRKSPFYAGFGNRLTDALSYRSVNIPSTRIFTINSNAEVSLDLLSLNKYKTGYTSMRETVDHFFPPVGMLVQEGGEEFTDFNYWRDAPLDLDEFSASESSRSESDGDDEDDEDDVDDRPLRSIRSEDEGSEDDVMSDDLVESTYLSQRASIDDSVDNLARQSTELEMHGSKVIKRAGSISESMHSDAPFEDAVGYRPSLETRNNSDHGLNLKRADS